jgi:hypothetical protein
MSHGFTCNGLLSILFSFYSNQESLVFIINMNEHDSKYFASLNLPFFEDITKLNTSQRFKKYNQGGIFYGTSRVLISDFVNKNVTINKISSFFVLNVEDIDPNRMIHSCAICSKKQSSWFERGFSSNLIKIND